MACDKNKKTEYEVIYKSNDEGYTNIILLSIALVVIAVIIFLVARI